MVKIEVIYFSRWDYMGKPKSSGGMGFRDLEVLNLALLAKQGWRLVQQPNSLVARILKDKYFKGSDFMHAKKGRNISFAWRSILNAREVLERGLVWRVGDGTQIWVWGDRWLPTPTMYQVQSPSLGLPSDALVSSLIDPVCGRWNEALIRDTFSVEEAEAICRLVPSPLGNPDKRV